MVTGVEKVKKVRYWMAIYLCSEVTQDVVWACGERTTANKMAKPSRKVEQKK